MEIKLDAQSAQRFIDRGEAPGNFERAHPPGTFKQARTISRNDVVVEGTRRKRIGEPVADGRGNGDEDGPRAYFLYKFSQETPLDSVYIYCYAVAMDLIAYFLMGGLAAVLLLASSRVRTER